MTFAPQAHNSATDVLAFHESHHDALKGTLEPVLHGNLPRPFRSEILQRNQAPVRLAAEGAPRPSPYRTPQWTELRTCIREVSPPSLLDDNACRVAEFGEGSLSDSALTTTSLPGYAVVNRLADLSQASDVDPAAVKAALREAERVLEAPTNAGMHREDPHYSNAMTTERFTDKEHLPLSHVRATSSIASSASAECREVDVESQWPCHHHKPRWHQRRHCDGSRKYSPGHATAASVVGTASCFHRPLAWSRPAPAPVLIGSPAPPRTALTATDITANDHADLHASPSTAGIFPPTMRWYEVYYAWMLYYQQLYAAQVLWEQQRQRAKRGKKPGHRSPHGKCTASRAANSGPEASTGKQRGGTHYAHVKQHCRAAAWAERGDSSEGGGHGMEEPLSVSRNAPPIRDNPPNFTPQPSSQTREARTSPAGGEKNAKGDDRAARIRAELHRLEEEYAALSCYLTNVEDEEAQPATCVDGRVGHFAAASSAGVTIAAPQRARSPAPTAPRTQSGKRFGSRHDAGPAPKRGSAAPAETWRTLSERQRSGTFYALARVRTSRSSSPQPFSQQRPHWRHW
ncbi:hypothetical protein, conserved [Leishmania tarentolae]|uniref:Uncharacterized protein n=1 Tax=Leishmania tarentolae TaxID=5689 RepID=A0A640KTI0_LEITA|nr:hypothetical protein, conserved [Leishmania tarentolae]